MKKRISSLLLLYFILASSLDLQLAQAQQISRPGEYQGYSEARFDSWVRESQYVEMSDGIKLAVDIFRPAVNGVAVDEPMPVVWSHTPYRRAYKDAQGIIRTGADSETTRTLLRHGYVVALVDTRGRGASQGARRGFQDRIEARDAYEMTEWFATQPWSDSNIGITGCSYVGGSTFHAATMNSPYLKAISPGFTDFEKYGFISRGGIMAQFNTRTEDPGQDFGQGVLAVDSDTDGSILEQALEEHLQGTVMADLWREIPYRDSYSSLVDSNFWQEVAISNYETEIESSDIGIFLWGNWFDEGSFESILAFNNLSNPKRLWMGGLGHCQVGDFPMHTEQLRFFDYFLKGIENGWMDEDPVYYFTNNAAEGNEWASATGWPLETAEYIDYSLTGSATTASVGNLQLAISLESNSEDQPDTFTVNYNPVCRDDVDLYFLFWPCIMENQGLSYQTAPLQEELHIAGHPVVNLWITSSTPDTDIFAYLEDISPDGDITIFSHGRLRASHRSEQSPPYENYMGLPFHRSFQEDITALPVGQAAQMRFDLIPASYILKTGHQLRLRITGADVRQRFRTVQFEQAPVVSILQSGSARSFVSVPVVSE